MHPSKSIILKASRCSNHQQILIINSRIIVSIIKTKRKRIGREKTKRAKCLTRSLITLTSTNCVVISKIKVGRQRQIKIILPTSQWLLRIRKRSNLLQILIKTIVMNKLSNRHPLPLKNCHLIRRWSLIIQYLPIPRGDNLLWRQVHYRQVFRTSYFKMRDNASTAMDQWPNLKILSMRIIVWWMLMSRDKTCIVVVSIMRRLKLKSILKSVTWRGRSKNLGEN